MTQTEAAYHAMMSQASWSAMERGQTDPPLSTLKRVAAALRVSLAALLGMRQ